VTSGRKKEGPTGFERESLSSESRKKPGYRPNGQRAQGGSVTLNRSFYVRTDRTSGAHAILTAPSETDTKNMPKRHRPRTAIGRRKKAKHDQHKRHQKGLTTPYAGATRGWAHPLNVFRSKAKKHLDASMWKERIKKGRREEGSCTTARPAGNPKNIKTNNLSWEKHVKRNTAFQRAKKNTPGGVERVWDGRAVLSEPILGSRWVAGCLSKRLKRKRHHCKQKNVKGKRWGS